MEVATHSPKPHRSCSSETSGSPWDLSLSVWQRCCRTSELSFGPNRQGCEFWLRVTIPVQARQQYLLVQA